VRADQGKLNIDHQEKDEAICLKKLNGLESGWRAGEGTFPGREINSAFPSCH